MQAIVHDRYGSPDTLRLRELATPAIGPDEVLIRVRAAACTRATFRGAGLAVPGATRYRPAPAEARRPGLRRRRHGRGGRLGRHLPATGRRGLRRRLRHLRRAGARQGGVHRRQAGVHRVREGGRHPDLGPGRAPRPARRRRAAARPAPPRQRRVRRRRQLRRPARQDAGRPRHRRVLDGQRRDGALAWRRPCDRLYPRGLHRRCGSVRPHPRQHREPAAVRGPSGADAARHARAQQRDRRHRPADARAPGLAARPLPVHQPPPPPLPLEPEARRPRVAGPARRRGLAAAIHRVDVRAWRIRPPHCG